MADMKEQLVRLYELQQVDTGAAALERVLRELDDGSTTEAELAAGLKKLSEMQGKHQELEGTLLDRELRVKSVEEEQETKSNQAYGGRISDPRQLSALGKKLEELGRFRDKLEEEILELMERTLEAGEAAAQQEALTQELGAKTSAVKARYSSERRRIEGELEQLGQQRGALREDIDDALIRQYESIGSRSGGQAVAVVRRGSCTGCKVTVPSMFAPKLQAGNELVRCESCRRILFLPPGEIPFAPEDE